jgi:hypothetical protein
MSERVIGMNKIWLKPSIKVIKQKELLKVILNSASEIVDYSPDNAPIHKLYI